MISAEKIPNNVGLSSNKRLQRALEHWQPKYIQWWKDMAPHFYNTIEEIDHAMHELSDIVGSRIPDTDNGSRTRS